MVALRIQGLFSVMSGTMPPCDADGVGEDEV